MGERRAVVAKTRPSAEKEPSAGRGRGRVQHPMKPQFKWSGGMRRGPQGRAVPSGPIGKRRSRGGGGAQLEQCPRCGCGEAREVRVQGLLLLRWPVPQRGERGAAVREDRLQAVVIQRCRAAPVLAWAAPDGGCVPLHRKKQALKMSRALTARWKVAVLVALAAERRLEKAGHTVATLSAEHKSVAARAMDEMVTGFSFGSCGWVAGGAASSGGAFGGEAAGAVEVSWSVVPSTGSPRPGGHVLRGRVDTPMSAAAAERTPRP
jgi:hypothetical protein